MVLLKLQFTVQDESNMLICTAMNNVVERIVDSSPKKLFNKLEAGDDNIPKPILGLCGQELIFKIQLSSYNLTVVDVFTPESIVFLTPIQPCCLSFLILRTYTYTTLYSHSVGPFVWESTYWWEGPC